MRAFIFSILISTFLFSSAKAGSISGSDAEIEKWMQAGFRMTERPYTDERRLCLNGFMGKDCWSRAWVGFALEKCDFEDLDKSLRESRYSRAEFKHKILSRRPGTQDEILIFSGSAKTAAGKRQQFSCEFDPVNFTGKPSLPTE